MYRLVIAVAFASSLSITASIDALARGGGRGGGHSGVGSHFPGNFAGRLQGGGIRVGSFGGIRGGIASGFRPSPAFLHGARVLDKHIDHHRRFQNKIIIFGGYGTSCYPVWNGYAWVSSCGLGYDY